MTNHVHKVVIFAKHKSPSAVKLATQLKKELDGRCVEYWDLTGQLEQIKDYNLSSATFGVLLGGDGTFLNFLNHVIGAYDFPLLGVNLGTVGFLTEFLPKEMMLAVEAALSYQLEVDPRPLIRVELLRGNDKIQLAHCFNDAVINKDTRTSLTRFRLTVGGKLYTEVGADGYIVSTSTGSTGYSLSAGGPLVHPSLEAHLLVPICPHSLLARPVVIPADKEIRIEVEKNRGSVYSVFDGQVTWKLKEGDQLLLTQSQKKASLFLHQDHCWFDVMRDKLGMR